MKLQDLDRKQVLTLIAIPLMIAALFIVPTVLESLYSIPAVYGAFGMIIIYFLLDQYMKRS
ncbi:hypothetical protein [Candidatus Nanohalococcus occultus]|uniref:Uncharacterized protein n=1 Tax=Candidatus Nanohalococcus occultus TaxID=2978047 RepID=A0ABY8CIR7_9ARCH|nr:hypothetical protein SVXNc_0769 [Candidatus Nanohaloarchaeota archaeon SVXNc]